MITPKDVQRMERLMDDAREHGMGHALAKAVRDADKIEAVEKCEARADILEDQGFAALAKPFRTRQAFLEAQMVSA